MSRRNSIVCDRCGANAEVGEYTVANYPDKWAYLSNGKLAFYEVQGGKPTSVHAFTDLPIWCPECFAVIKAALEPSEPTVVAAKARRMRFE